MGVLSLVIGLIILFVQALKFYGKDRSSTSFVNGVVLFAILLILAPAIEVISDTLIYIDETIMYTIEIKDQYGILSFIY